MNLKIHNARGGGRISINYWFNQYLNRNSFVCLCKLNINAVFSSISLENLKCISYFSLQFPSILFCYVRIIIISWNNIDKLFFSMHHNLRKNFMRRCKRTTNRTYFILKKKHIQVDFNDLYQFHYVWSIVTSVKCFERDPFRL